MAVEKGTEIEELQKRAQRFLGSIWDWTLFQGGHQIQRWNLAHLLEGKIPIQGWLQQVWLREGPGPARPSPEELSPHWLLFSPQQGSVSRVEVYLARPDGSTIKPATLPGFAELDPYYSLACLSGELGIKSGEGKFILTESPWYPEDGSPRSALGKSWFSWRVICVDALTWLQQFGRETLEPDSPHSVAVADFVSLKDGQLTMSLSRGVFPSEATLEPTFSFDPQEAKVQLASVRPGALEYITTDGMLVFDPRPDRADRLLELLKSKELIPNAATSGLERLGLQALEFHLARHSDDSDSLSAARIGLRTVIGATTLPLGQLIGGASWEKRRHYNSKLIGFGDVTTDIFNNDGLLAYLNPDYVIISKR